MVFLCDASTGTFEAAPERLSGAVLALAFSADGVIMAPYSPKKEPSVALLQLGPDCPKAIRRETLPELMRAMAELTALASAPDGRLLAAGDVNGSVWVWDRATARLADSLLRKAKASTTEWKWRYCAVSPDGSFIVSASDDGTLKVWDAATGRERATLAGHTLDVRHPRREEGGRHVQPIQTQAPAETCSRIP